MPISNAYQRAKSGMANFLPRLFSQPMPRPRPFSEMGVSGTPIYSGYILSPERHPKLIGQEKHRTFADIMANTSVVAAGMRYFLNVISKPSWTCESESDKPGNKLYCEFVEDVLKDLHTPWNRIVRRAGTYRFHGFNVQEWTAKRRDDGKIGFDDVEGRPQWTIWRWEVDERGTVLGVWQRDPLTGKELGLPRGKIMYLVDDTLNDSPEGLGLLRHVVEPSERLKEYLDMEKVGFLRDLRGIPIGRAPMSEMDAMVSAGILTGAQKSAALNELNKFIQLEKKGKDSAILLPSDRFISKSDTGDTVTGEKKWDVETVQATAPGLPDINNAIQRMNEEMARILGVEQMMLGSSSAGSFALAKDKSQQMYLMAESVLRDIRQQVQHDIIWPLWSLNGFPDDMMPQLKTEDIAPKDVQQISQTLRDMAMAGAVIAPDDEVQNFIRDMLGVPHANLDKLAAEAAQQQAVTAQSGAVRQQQMNQMSKPGFGQKPGVPGAPGQPAANPSNPNDPSWKGVMDEAAAAQADKEKAKPVKKLEMTRNDIALVLAHDQGFIRKRYPAAHDWCAFYLRNPDPLLVDKSRADKIRMGLSAYFAHKGLEGNWDFEYIPEDAAMVPPRRLNGSGAHLDV